MDSGGILCLHYPFCSSPTLATGICYAPDVYPMGAADKSGGGDEVVSPLGTAGRDITFVVVGGDGLGGCSFPGASRL